MTKFRALAAVFACLVLHGTAAAEERLRIGIGRDYPPFYYANGNGKLVGFEVEIAQALCTAIGATCTLVPNEKWNDLLPGLIAGRFDLVMSSVSITEPRKRVVLFSRKYYSSRVSMVAQRDIPIDPRRPESMSGRIIGVQNATVHEAYAKSLSASLHTKVATYQSLPEALLQLKRGEIDAVLGDKVALLGLLQKNSPDCCTLIGDDIDDPAVLGEGIGAVFRQNGTALKTRFDQAIEQILQSGEYARINNRYFPFDIY